MRNSIIIIIFITFINFIQSPVFGAESTNSASVQQKLDQLKQQIASKAAKLKSEINQKLQNKAYVGVIKSKSSTTLTLAARSGTKIVNINQDTLYEPKLSKKVTLKEEDSIAALGDVDETGVLTARKIVKLPTTNSQQLTTPSGLKTYLWGQVLSISDEIITIKDSGGKSAAVSLVKLDQKVEIGQTIIVTGLSGKNDILTASFIFITNKPKVLPPKEATQSATSSSTKR